MKTRTLVATMIIILPLVVFGENDWTVSFQTGFPLNQTSFGVKIGALAPYGGIGMFRVSANYESSNTSWERDYYQGHFYKYRERSSEFEGSATFLMPFAGLRYYVKQEKILAYIKGDIMFALPFIKGTNSGKRVYYNSDGTVSDRDEWSDNLTKKDEERFKDVLDFIVISPGVGLEYPLSDHFSIGGEFGMRWLLYNYEQNGSDSDEYWQSDWEEKMNATIGITYTSFSLNYRF